MLSWTVCIGHLCVPAPEKGPTHPTETGFPCLCCRALFNVTHGVVLRCWRAEVRGGLGAWASARFWR